MQKVKFYKKYCMPDFALTYAIIATKHEKGEWVLVRHKDRSTWEFPAGHIEENELPLDAAKRELKEEIGANCFSISAIADYSVTSNGTKKYGRLFYATVEKFNEKPDSEIDEAKLFSKMPNALTYTEVHWHLHKFVEDYLSNLKKK